MALTTLSHINDNPLISHIGFRKGCVLAYTKTLYLLILIDQKTNIHIILKGDLYEIMTSYLNIMKNIFSLITVIIFKLIFLILTTRHPVSFVKMQVLIIQNTVCICVCKLHWKAS